LILFFLALVAVSFCQDSDNCFVHREWSVFQVGPQYLGGLWEDQELIGWGMDGDNKWNDYWKYNFNLAGVNHYNYATCSDGEFGSNDGLPNYIQNCGSCSLTSNTVCNCYPFTDVAGSWLVSASPEANGSENDPVAPEGFPSLYNNPNPPYQQFPVSDGTSAWTEENCKQYQPYYVYYYTYRLKISNNGNFYKSFGISRGFQPSDNSWNEFCENIFANENTCFVPSFVGGSSPDTEQALFGADYQYQDGFWREDEVTQRIQFLHHHFENGCHMKAREHRYPTAQYCGDDSGWKYGAGTTAHVRFGCDTSTFQDTATDAFDIDDSDCSSVYLQFDHLNPMTNVAADYDEVDGSARLNRDDEYSMRSKVSFAPDQPTLVRGDGSQCWYLSKFIDHRSQVPNYRTPCNPAAVLAVPFLALVSTLFVALRNMF